MATPTEAAFAIPELLERILLLLPLHDLLLCRRVCTSWRALWATSPRIQRALFLKPSHDYTIQIEDFGDDYTYDYAWRSSIGKRVSTKAILNPFLNSFIHEDDYPPSTRDETSYLRILVEFFVCAIKESAPMEPLEDEDDAFHSEEASWRRMSFTQPPLSKFEAKCSKNKGLFWVKYGKGVLVDQIQAVLHRHLRRCVNCPRYFDEDNRWGWTGEEDVRMVDVGITGWEMVAELCKYPKT